jgi:NADH-ubiquinone oxidoreductase chain 5
MEGPTPVSALIHAATMVTAGVFLVIKMSVLFEFTTNMLLVIVLIGSATSFFAATAGLLQSDIKKVIAYSTCSQLGYMFFVCGLSGYQIGFFHLANHAFFKALLFLGAGCIIHSITNEQDMRKFGAVIRLLPITYVLLLIGSLSLMGFPFLTGYYSKDLIIEFAFSKYTALGDVAAFLGLITASITAFYSLRVLFLTFLLLRTNLHRQLTNIIHELSDKMFISLVPLIFGSIFLGYIAKDIFVGVGSPF